MRKSFLFRGNFRPEIDPHFYYARLFEIFIGAFVRDAGRGRANAAKSFGRGVGEPFTKGAP